MTQWEDELSFTDIDFGPVDDELADAFAPKGGSSRDDGEDEEADPSERTMLFDRAPSPVPSPAAPAARDHPENDTFTELPGETPASARDADDTGTDSYEQLVSSLERNASTGNGPGAASNPPGGRGEAGGAIDPSPGNGESAFGGAGGASGARRRRRGLRAAAACLAIALVAGGAAAGAALSPGKAPGEGPQSSAAADSDEAADTPEEPQRAPKVAYTVRYLDADTGDEVAPAKAGKATTAGKKVVERAPEIADYGLVSDSPVSLLVTEDAAQNVIAFSYRAIPEEPVAEPAPYEEYHAYSQPSYSQPAAAQPAGTSSGSSSSPSKGGSGDSFEGSWGNADDEDFEGTWGE